MNKFLSSTFKNKSLLIFAVLFFVFLGIFMPAVSHADFWDDIGNTVSNGLSSFVKPAFSEMVEVIGRFIIWIAYTVMDIGKWLLDTVLTSEFIQKAVTKDPTVVLGWTIVRDLANMFIVLGFMVVAIATILRLREYEAQKLLLPLIVIALLINFSLLICGIVIDGANITMNYFLSGAINVSGGSITNAFVGAARDSATDNAIKATLQGNDPNWSAFAAIVVSVSLYAFIAAMLFVIYAFLFIFRYVALMCLTILSPLAFICFVFPRTKAIYEKWLSQFVQWAVVGIPAIFFIYLASNIMGPTLSMSGGSAANVNKSILAFFVPAAFLYFAYTLTFQISAIGAAGAIGLAAGAIGFARGATGRVAGGAGRLALGASGLNRAGQWANDKVTSIGERLGLVSRGTMANRMQGRLDEARKRVANLSEADLVSLAKKGNRAWTAEERQNSAAATELLMKKGKGHKLEDTLERSLLHAKTFGANMGDMAKGEYRVAGLNQTEIDRLVRTRRLTPAQAKTELERQYIDDNIHSMSGEQRRNINPDHITPDLLTSKSMTVNIVKSFRTAEDDQINKFGNRATHTIDPAVSAQFTHDIAAAHTAGDQREEKRLNDIQAEILKILS